MEREGTIMSVRITQMERARRLRTEQELKDLDCVALNGKCCNESEKCKTDCQRANEELCCYFCDVNITCPNTCIEIWWYTHSDENKYNELWPPLNRLVNEITRESNRHRIKVMKLTSDEDFLQIIKDQGSYHAGYHAGIDYAVNKLKASKLYKDIKDEEDLLY